MEEHLKDLNKTLNRMMSEDPKFTDGHRVKIRTAISKTRRKKSFNSRPWMAFGSAAACLLLIIVAVQFVFNNTGHDTSMERADGGAAGSAADAGASTDSSAKTAALEKHANKTSEHLEASGEASKMDKAADTTDAKMVEGPVLPLNEKLLGFYETFRNSGNQADLTGLKPFEVMQLYYHAFEQKDYSTQYDLYYHDPSGSMMSKQEYIQDSENDSASGNNLGSLSGIDVFEVEFRTNPIDQKEAYVKWGGSGEAMKFFRLIFDEQVGVWTVSWTPIQ